MALADRDDEGADAGDDAVGVVGVEIVDVEIAGLFQHHRQAVDGDALGAGLVARRIVSFVREGESIGSGERFGLIRFGSRVDVYLPVGSRVLVSEGQLTVAGETVLCDLSQPQQRETAYRVS